MKSLLLQNTRSSYFQDQYYAISSFFHLKDFQKTGRQVKRVRHEIAYITK